MQATGRVVKAKQFRRVNNPQQIAEVLDWMVAEQGSTATLSQVCWYVRHLAATSIAHPENSKLQSEFENWAIAAKALCAKLGRPFEQRIEDGDVMRARGMGIVLD